MNKKLIKVFKIFSIFIFFIILLPNPQKSFSKYQTIVSNNDSKIDIASFVFLSDIEIDVPLVLDETLYPGITKDYYFNVRNYNNDTICDITLNYSFKLEKTNNLPVDIEIYRNDVLLDIETNSEFDFILNKKVKTEDNYKIVFTWDEAKDNFSYANLEDVISLSIIANQID